MRFARGIDHSRSISVLPKFKRPRCSVARSRPEIKPMAEHGASLPRERYNLILLSDEVRCLRRATVLSAQLPKQSFLSGAPLPRASDPALTSDYRCIGIFRFRPRPAKISPGSLFGNCGSHGELAPSSARASPLEAVTAAPQISTELRDFQNFRAVKLPRKGNLIQSSRGRERKALLNVRTF